jgi:hypothetical protein
LRERRMLYTLCMQCNENRTIPAPAAGWDTQTVIPCPTCTQPLGILGVALTDEPAEADAAFADVTHLVNTLYDLQAEWGECCPLGPPSDPTMQACYVRDVREVLHAHRATLAALLEA